jgi:phosphoglycerol transferase MdoB-like AlkP superfamily enzyme
MTDTKINQMDNTKMTKDSLINLRDEIQKLDQAFGAFLTGLRNTPSDCATFLILFRDHSVLNMAAKLREAKLAVGQELKYWDQTKDMTPTQKGDFFYALAAGSSSHDQAQD